MLLLQLTPLLIITEKKKKKKYVQQLDGVEHPFHHFHQEIRGDWIPVDTTKEEVEEGPKDLKGLISGCWKRPELPGSLTYGFGGDPLSHVSAIGGCLAALN